MRVFALAVFAVIAANGAAEAAECSRGMLWPYVRNPGDCLTDEELKAGQKGVYSGPVNTNPDVASIKVVTPPQNSVGGGSGARGNGLLDKLGVPTFSLTGDSNTAYDSLGPAGTVRHAGPAEVACNKGYLWPFVRDPGDCLTDEEKASGRTGVYRAEAYVAPTPVSATANGANGNASPPPPPAPSCGKGLLWPFVRSAGDCPTDAEKAEAAKTR